MDAHRLLGRRPSLPILMPGTAANVSSNASICAWLCFPLWSRNRTLYEVLLLKGGPR